MNLFKSLFASRLIAIGLIFISCKTSQEENGNYPEAIEINFSQNFDAEFFSQNEIKYAATLLFENKITELYNISSDSLKQYFTLESFQDYFAIVSEIYGNLKRVKDYGFAGTENYVGIDLKACYEKIDTVELRLGYHLKNAPVLSHVSVAPFRTSKSNSIDSLCQPIVRHILNKDIETLCRVLPKKFQTHTLLTKLRKNWLAHMNEIDFNKGHFALQHKIIPITPHQTALQVVYAFNAEKNSLKKVLLTYQIINGNLQLTDMDFSS